MHSGSSIPLSPSSLTSSTDPSISMAIGIASLVLEGRPLSEDDYLILQPDDFNQQHSSANKNKYKISNTTEHSIQDVHRIKLKLLQLHGDATTCNDIECHGLTQITATGNMDTNTSKSSLKNITITDFDSKLTDDDADCLGDDTVEYCDLGNRSELFYDAFHASTLADTCLQTIPRSFYRSVNLLKLPTPSSITGAIEKYNNLFTTTSTSSSPSCSYTGTKINNNKKIDIPKQGPHCEIFLKKIGIIKLTEPITATSSSNHKNEIWNIDEIGYNHHICNEFTTSVCRRWNKNLNQIKTIFHHNEILCIEVYLGPEMNKILLEQWIIQIVDKSNHNNNLFNFNNLGNSNTNNTTMTIQSLCSAIRSQLYFSQISSWNDLLLKRQSTTLTHEFLNNPRIKKKSYLDIIYHIKSLKQNSFILSNFNEKPVIHNFPDTTLSDSYHLKVCLKSSQRFECIPKVINITSQQINNTVTSGSLCSGSSVSSSSSSSSSSSVSNNSIVIDINIGSIKCNEKGKHQCKHDSNDDEDLNITDVIEEIPHNIDKSNCSSSSSSSNSGNSISNLHREKQLLKYKKRLMKREKKKKVVQSNTELQHSNTFSTHASINSIRLPLYSFNKNDINFNSGNSSNNNSNSKLIQTNKVEMMSVSTQTDNFIEENGSETSLDINFPTCNYCGNDMQCICWNCDKKLLYTNNNNCNSNNNNNLNNGDLLLQSIYRTTNRNRQIKNCDKKLIINSNNIKKYDEEYIERSITCDNLNSLDVGDCRLCIKRQKIKHDNYLTNSSHNSDSENYNYRRTMSENLSGYGNDEAPKNDDLDTIETKAKILLSPSSVSLNDVELNDGLSFEELKGFRRAFSEDVIDSIILDNDVVDCKCNNSFVNRPTMMNTNDLKLNESQNNTYIKNNNLSTDLSSSPTDSKTTMTSPTKLLPIPAQTNNNKPLLSPRFYKQAAILKRRSRHLSDRSSERSSNGSEIDQNFSDEEYGCGLDNTLNSPNNLNSAKNFLKFGSSKALLIKKQPLLGTLEESLLQNRFEPKYQVQGFKVLLGASGGFCPTQLTIPAVTNLYELHGQTFSTPYVCEIRLPRKGYSIPITGTVQTTLLNPQGTVVRMFVVPYDLRDMPNMSTTFMRQRVLTCDETMNKNGKKLEELSNAEQMKLLRYAIHLRFQRSRSGRLSLHTDIKLLILRRTDCDTASAHAKSVLELPNELKIVNIMPENPKYSTRIDKIDKKPIF